MIIQNEIVTTFMARGGNALAMMGQYSSGMMNIGRQSQGASRNLSQASQQARAFGTTLRYAFAGSVLFGVANMVVKLKDLQQQMGLISAIAGPAGTNLTGGALSKLEDELVSKSVNARTSLSELNDATINYLSTVQGAKASEIPDIISRIGITAKLSQTPVEDLTKAITTVNLAAGRQNNLKNTNALLREWFQLVSTAPGGISSAPQIAQQLGPLNSIARQGRLTPEQVFGFSLGSLRFGATPSTALRGGQYFLQSLFMPNPGQGKVLAGAGFTPQRLERDGGAKFVMDYLKHVQGLGARPTRKGVTQFGSSVDLNPDTEAELQPNQNIPGMSPQSLAFLRSTIGRIHGIRTATVLISQLERKGNVSSLSEVLKNFHQLMKKDTGGLNKAVQRYRDQTPLQSAAIALDSMRVQISRDTAFALNPVSRGISAGALGIARHPNVRYGIEAGGAAFLAALGIRRMFKGGGIGKLFGGGGQAIVASQAAQDIASGGTGRGESPLNPIYVTVVGQIFGGNGGGGGPHIPPVIPLIKDPKWYTKFGARVGVPLTAAFFASKYGSKALTGKDMWEGSSPSNIIPSLKDIWLGQDWRNRKFNQRKFPFLRSLKDGSSLFKGNAFADDIWTKFQSGKLSASGANKALQRLNNEQAFDQLNKVESANKRFRNMGFIAQGEVELNIKIKDGGKVTKKRVKVPASLYSGGKGPSTRGQRKNIKADFPNVIDDWWKK